MRPKDDQGVVDARLRVYDVDGLRVVDNSIPPVMLDQHPTLTIYMLAEKAADMIKQDHGLL
jgi:choline dehydrogenase